MNIAGRIEGMIAKVVATLHREHRWMVELFISGFASALERRSRLILYGNAGSDGNLSHTCQDSGLGAFGKRKIDKTSVIRQRKVGLTDSAPSILPWANGAGFVRVIVESIRLLLDWIFEELCERSLAGRSRCGGIA